MFLFDLRDPVHGDEVLVLVQKRCSPFRWDWRCSRNGTISWDTMILYCLRLGLGFLLFGIIEALSCYRIRSFLKRVLLSLRCFYFVPLLVWYVCFVLWWIELLKKVKRRKGEKGRVLISFSYQKSNYISQPLSLWAFDPDFPSQDPETSRRSQSEYPRHQD